MSQSNIPHVVITSMHRSSYFQWFLLGFYYLQSEGKIKLSFRCKSLFENLSFITGNKYIIYGYIYIARKLKLNNKWLYKDSYHLTGYVKFNKQKKYFCLDSADAPFLFDSEQLEKVSCYFKMQCPIKIDEKGFELSDNIIIPWCDHKHKSSDGIVTAIKERAKCDNLFANIDKIKPLMIGPRRLSICNRYKSLDKAYKNYYVSRTSKADKKLMCYFGNAKGPKPIESTTPDFDSESNILGYFKERINHPNEKRAKARDIIQSLGKDYDAKLINETHSDSGVERSHPDLIVPLDKFCEHISHFQYNLNISGYRMSIPNRFIESFIVGTAILTDKLAVKWYKPFDKEVIETIPMGYLPIDKVDWEQFKEDITSLPEINKEEILKSFDEKWQPKVVAQYIIDTIIHS